MESVYQVPGEAFDGGGRGMLLACFVYLVCSRALLVGLLGEDLDSAKG